MNGEMKNNGLENTVKIYMMGAAAVIVSGVKMEDWKLAEKYAPESLRIADENGEPAFRVMTGKGTGSMNKYGVVWGSYLSEEGAPTVTILIDDEVEDRKEAVMDVIGPGLLYLAEIEKAMPEIVEKVREKTQRLETYLTRM